MLVGVFRYYLRPEVRQILGCPHARGGVPQNPLTVYDIENVVPMLVGVFRIATF